MNYLDLVYAQAVLTNTRAWKQEFAHHSWPVKHLIPSGYLPLLHFTLASTDNCVKENTINGVYLFKANLKYPIFRTGRLLHWLDSDIIRAGSGEGRETTLGRNFPYGIMAWHLWALELVTITEIS
jgi:hypothetical protein